MNTLFDEFKNEKFQALPYEKKKEIVNKWTDIQFGDIDGYKDADEERRNEVKHNIASNVIDFSSNDITPAEKEHSQKRLDKIDEYIPDITEDFFHGAAKNVADYTASGAKLLGAKDLQKRARIASETLDKNIDNKYVGMAGEILGDPLNLTPAGVVSKGTKVARVAKSIAGGAVVGAGTMAAKNYGDDTVTQDDKNLEMGVGAGLTATINGIIAVATKGKVTNAIKDVGDVKSASELTDNVMKNAKDFGLSPDETKALEVEIIDAVKDAKPKNAPQEIIDTDVLRKTYNKFSDKHKISDVPKNKPYEPDFRMVPQNPPVVYDAFTEVEQGFKNLADEIGGSTREQVKEIVPQPPKETPKELPLEQQLQKAQSDKTQSIRKAEFEKSVDNTTGAEAHYADATKHEENIQALQEQIDEKNRPTQEKLQELTQHPRYQELLDMRRDVSAKDAQSPQKLVKQREIVHDNNGDGYETNVIPAQYEKNYANDFELTKSDIKKLENGKADENTLAKLETDLGTLDNHPDYSPQQKAEPANNVMSDKDWEEANTLFAHGADNLAVATYAGVDEDETWWIYRCKSSS